MSKFKQQLLQSENYRVLLESSLLAIPFNIVVAGVLCLDLYYKNIPKYLILLWYFTIIFVSAIRWIYTQHVLKKTLYTNNNGFSVVVFLVLTLLMGCAWGLCYVIFLPYLTEVHEVAILLILGGMASGASTSLSGYLPAYFLFMFPMLLPVIIYNYSFLQFDRSIVATMCVLFVIMIGTIARMNHSLLEKIFQLNNQKDYLIKELSVSNKRLEESNEEIRVMSITDSLTGLYNRRYFDHSLVQELGRAKRNKYPLGLILIDIDNFKFLNDTFGHPYGDTFLISVASVLKKSMRRTNDIIVRLGGDEFAAVLADMSINDVSTVCDKIRAEFAKENIHKNVTLSIGIICVESGNCDELKKIISTADQLLYKAKEKGKNQTISQIL